MKLNKQFDCVKMKNAIQATILGATAAMNTAEWLFYFNAPFAIDGFDADIITAKTNALLPENQSGMFN
ncbi:MAG: hypothetical protein LBT00_06935 [Spirochaetaceae bacterium]|jgi:hypothetical protein|nr:hypothetical protein [Spirochaetaceae bacterium]